MRGITTGFGQSALERAIKTFAQSLLAIFGASGIGLLTAATREVTREEGNRIMAATYTVQPGDTLSGIAEKFGVSLQALEAANPQIQDPNRIFPGQVITIP